MRVVFLPAPAIGHAFPMVPLAWALRSAGHTTWFVTGGDGLEVRHAGMPVYDAVPGERTVEMLFGFLRSTPELFAPMRGLPLDELARRRPLVIAAWDPYVDRHVEVALGLRPDLVVYDPMFAAGPVVAALLGIPAIAHGIGIAEFGADLLGEPPADAALRRHGVKLPDQVIEVSCVPAGLSDATPDVRMRYVPYNGGGVLPSWLTEPRKRPRVAVTLGTIVPEVRGLTELDPLLAMAGQVDAEFVLALTGTDRLPPLPDNVRAPGWVPWSALLAESDVAVHHGGSGTALACCAAGVPQLLLPEGGDRVFNAEVLRARDAACVADAEKLTAGMVTALLDDEGLRQKATAIGAEMAAMPSPAQVADEVVARVGGGRV